MHQFAVEGRPVIAGLVLTNYSDNCSIVSIGFQLSGATTGSGGGNDASGNFNVGLTTVTFTVWDVNGNSFSCSFNVDMTGSPVVTGSTFSPSAAGTGTFTLTYSYTDVNGCFYSFTSFELPSTVSPFTFTV